MKDLSANEGTNNVRNIRASFEAWAKDSEYDISFDLKAPCYVYVCEKTDAAWDGYREGIRAGRAEGDNKAAHEGAEAELQTKIDELQRQLDMYEAEDYNRQQGD